MAQDTGSYLILREGEVVNIVEATHEIATERGLLSAGQAKLGWRVLDGKLAPPDRNLEAEWAVVRDERDRRLEEDVDPISAVRWESMEESERQAWKDYRQLLLDIPDSTDDPAEVVWPARPGRHGARRRNRWSNGRFRGDDPATPDINEAWTDAPLESSGIDGEKDE